MEPPEELKPLLKMIQDNAGLCFLWVFIQLLGYWIFSLLGIMNESNFLVLTPEKSRDIVLASIAFITLRIIYLKHNNRDA